MATDDRRNTRRIPAEFKINYIHEGDYLISYTKNISVDGMFIYTENPPEIGQELELTFSMGPVASLAVKATVVWVNQVNSSNDTGVGVQFMDLSDIQKDDILHYIKKIAVFDDFEKRHRLVH